jgi:hypothetical protein
VETEFAWALMQHDLSGVCCGMSPQFVWICVALTLTSHVFWTDHDDQNYHGVVEEMNESDDLICDVVSGTGDDE